MWSLAADCVAIAFRAMDRQICGPLSFVSAIADPVALRSELASLDLGELDGQVELPHRPRRRLPGRASEKPGQAVHGRDQGTSARPRPGEDKTGFFWALVRNDYAWSGDEPPGVVYFYVLSPDGEHGEEFLDGFNGILQADGYSSDYNHLTKATRKGGEPITLAFCWAHARRKLKEVYHRDGSPIAREELDRIAWFYEVEVEIRSLPPGQRLSARETRTVPLVAEFRVWLDEQRSTLSAKPRLGEKLGYIHCHWDGLQQFLKDDGVEIDSKNVENLIRPLALTQKNALYAGHDESGVAWASFASLIESAKTNGIEPFAYLKATLEQIADGHPTSRIDELLPWNFVETSIQNS